MHIGVQPNDRQTTAQRTGVLRRLAAAVADFFDPDLRCNDCGFVDKRHRFARTGVAHEYSMGSGMFRSTTSEIEFSCPECDATQFVQEIRSAYPLF